MTKIGWLALGLAVLTGMQSAVAQTATDVALISDRIETDGGSMSADLYGSGNDDGFQSYGAVTFNLTAADFGLAAIMDIDTVDLSLTFNDRGFSDGSQFELYFTADDFAGDGTSNYAGLVYDESCANDPSAIDADIAITIPPQPSI